MHYIFPYHHFYQPFFLGVGALEKSTGHTNSHPNTSAVQSTLWLCSDIPLHLLGQNYGGPDKLQCMFPSLKEIIWTKIMVFSSMSTLICLEK